MPGSPPTNQERRRRGRNDLLAPDAAPDFSLTAALAAPSDGDLEPDRLSARPSHYPPVFSQTLHQPELTTKRLGRTGRQGIIVGCCDSQSPLGGSSQLSRDANVSPGVSHCVGHELTRQKYCEPILVLTVPDRKHVAN